MVMVTNELIIKIFQNFTINNSRSAWLLSDVTLSMTTDIVLEREDP